MWKNSVRFAVEGLLPQGFTEFSGVVKLGINRGRETSAISGACRFPDFARERLASEHALIEAQAPREFSQASGNLLPRFSAHKATGCTDTWPRAWQNHTTRFGEDPKRIAALEPVLTLLIEHNFVRPGIGPQRSGAGRKPSPVYEVNPLAE